MKTVTLDISLPKEVAANNFLVGTFGQLDPFELSDAFLKPPLLHGETCSMNAFQESGKIRLWKGHAWGLRK